MLAPDSPNQPLTVAANPPLAGCFEAPDWRAAMLAALVSLGVYGASLAPGVTLGNSGMLAASAWHGGVPANPGYPVWVLYSWAFAHGIPGANVAWRVALGSAVASALAAGLVALMTSRSGVGLLTGMPRWERLRPREQACLRTVCGAIAGLAFALSGPVWSQAVIVETWALTHLLSVLTFACLLRWALAPAQTRYLAAAVFAFALLLTNAQHLLVLAPAIALCVLLAAPQVGRDFVWAFLPAIALLTLPNQHAVRLHADGEPNNVLLLGFLLPLVLSLGVVFKTHAWGTHWRAALLCLAALLAGWVWVFYPALASLSNPPVNWGYPRSAEGFWHILAQGQFEAVSLTPSLTVFLSELRTTLLALAPQFGWQYLLPAALPFCWLPCLSRPGRGWCVALGLLGLSAGPLLLGQLHPGNNPEAAVMALRFIGPALALAAVAAGWGLMLLAPLLARPSAASATG